MVVTAAISQDDSSMGAKSLFCADNGVCSAPSTTPRPRATQGTGNPASQGAITVLGLSYWIDLQLPNGELTRVSANRRFATGDRIRLSLQPNRAGYLYIFNLGSSGQTTPLFPKGDEAARAEAGQMVSVPGKSFLRFSSPPGEELVLIVFSPTPISEYAVRQASTENASVVAIAEARGGAKDLLRDDDFDAATASKASFAVLKPGNENKAINLSIRLKHQ